MYGSMTSGTLSAVAIALMLALSACGDSPPQGWSAPDRGLVARLTDRCPDLRGSWRLNPPALPGNRLMIGGPAVHGLQLKAGRDYRCEDGWLKGRVAQTEPMLLPSLVAPWQVFGTAWFALDRQGQLIGRVDFSQRRFISLWCGDGCKGFDAGTAHGLAWGRWPRTEPAWHGEPTIPWAIPSLN